MPDSWYRQKAAECGRLADKATRPEDRDQYRYEEKLWRQSADGFDARDKIALAQDAVA
jgi:hypothetical protein